MIKGVIFDLDGTLLDTLYDLYEATNYALERQNYPTITYKMTRDFVGNGNRKLLNRAFDSDDDKIIDKAFEDFKYYYGIHQKDHTVPYDGTIELLEKLKKLGLKMAVVSNKYQEAVNNLCIPIFGKYIDVFVGSSPNMKTKPDPDMVYYALDKLNLKADEVIFVGDSDVDIQTGINAKTHDVIAVTWGFKDKDVLIKAGAKTIVDNNTNLYNIILEEIKNG